MEQTRHTPDHIFSGMSAPDQWMASDRPIEVSPGDGRFQFVEKDRPPRLLLGVNLLDLTEPS